MPKRVARAATSLFVSMLLSQQIAQAQSNALQPPPLPTQHIVFVIDNSGSMQGSSGSDPLRLRGVAACLVLDAVELSSNVEAGVVFFGDRATTDGKLHPSHEIRRRLQSGRLLAASGGTNMAEGLEQALAILSGSPASLKRIVLISDGMPDNPIPITTNLVPHAVAANVQIFALGVSSSIDQKFLDTVTIPTGGKTLIADHHRKLLQMAKELVSDLDNTYTLAKDALPSNVLEREFIVPKGVDRARMTLILDHPTEFAPNDIEFVLAGPVGFSDQTYTVEPDDLPRVVAWTAFFSAPGTYKLQVKVKKGSRGHLGLYYFVEALSNLHLRIVPSPAATQYEFNQQVRIDVEVMTAAGAVAPSDARISGEIQTASGGSTALAFTDFSATFGVPAVLGKHTIIVRVQTPLSRAEGRVAYTAFSQAPPTLKATPEHLLFDPALTAAHPTVEESFKLFAEFPQGKGFRSTPVSFTWVIPAGIGELTANGAIVRPAPAQYTIPAAGLELRLRIRMDPSKPLPNAGKYTGAILVTSKEAADLRIAFDLEVSVPEFVLRKELKGFALWWDPAQIRSVHLGTLQTNLSASSKFSVVIPEAITDAKAGKIAALALSVNGRIPEAEPVEAGKLRYSDLELPAGKGIRLDLVVTPDPDSGWPRHEITKPLQIRIASDLGMTVEPTPIFRNKGPVDLPLFERRALYGLRVAAFALFLIAGSVIGLRTWIRFRLVRRFWHYRPGSLLPLGYGAIQVGNPGDGAGALVLPNDGSELDERTLGTVIRDGVHQVLESRSEYLRPQKKRLAPGDVVQVTDPDDEDGEKNIWEIEYIQSDPGIGGEVLVVSSPAMTAGRLLRGLAISLLMLWVLHACLGSKFTAALAYQLPWIESVYTR